MTAFLLASPKVGTVLAVYMAALNINGGASNGRAMVGTLIGLFGAIIMLPALLRGSILKAAMGAAIIGIALWAGIGNLGQDIADTAKAILGGS